MPGDLTTATTAFDIAALWSGLLIVLLLILSVLTVQGRWKHRVRLGDGGNERMAAVSRAFGNAAEYIPVGIAALILLSLIGTGHLWLHLTGGLLFAGRVIHAFGMIAQNARPGPGRVGGMLLTWAALALAAVLLLIRAAA